MARHGWIGMFAGIAVSCAAHAAAAKNLLVNSSFEAGIGSEIAIGRWYMNGLPSARLDDKVRVHGRVALRLPFSARAYRPDGPYGIELRAATPVRLEKGKRYSFSVYLRTDVPNASASIGMTPLKPYEYRGKDLNAEKINLGLGRSAQGYRYPWRRYATTFTAAKSGEAYWWVRIESRQRGNLWVDALQFEEGNATAYAPAQRTAFGLVDGALGHIYDPGKPVPFTLRAWNGGKRKRTDRVTVRVLDESKREVLRRSLTVAVGPGQARDVPLSLDVGRNGVFLAELTIEGRPGYVRRQSFSVLPRPRHIRPERSSFGAYLTASEEAVRILARAGFHWTATLTSAGVMADWAQVEARKGRYAWRDADVDLFRRHGFAIMFNLEGWAYPRWAAKLSRAERTAAFARYVEAVTRHYRGRVRYFTLADEIHNKVPGSHMIGRREAAWRTPAEYAAWHTAAARAARRGNPDCRIVLNTESSGAFGPVKLLQNLSPKTVDVLAGNYYPYPDHVRIFKRMADKYGIGAVWAPGVAINTWPVYFRRYGGPRYDAAENLRQIVRKVVRSFANGAHVFFHYTASYVGNTNVYSVFEHDSSLETGGAQFAALAWLVDGWHSARPVHIAAATGIEAYRFDRDDGTAVFALWPREAGSKQTLRLAYGVNGVALRDRWGNLLDAGAAAAGGYVALDGGIRFLLTPAAKGDALERALAGGRLVQAALSPGGRAVRAGRYALETRTVGKGKGRHDEIRLWYDAGPEGWLELLRRGMEKDGPVAAIDRDGLTLQFRRQWDGRAGHMRVGTLSSDLFWGARFRRWMPGRAGAAAGQAGRIADESLKGRVIQAARASPPPAPAGGRAPTGYAIEAPRGLGRLVIATAGEQPNLRYPMPGAWDIYVWRGEGPARKIGIWRYVHAGTPHRRDIRVRVRVVGR